MKEKLFQERSTPHGKLACAAEWIELVLGIIILILCIVAAAGMVCTTDVKLLFQEADYLQKQLSHACTIIIGIELITMITSYSIDSVVDVLLLAVVRQSIVEHMVPTENLLTVLAVGVLFLIRKYLYISKLGAARSSKTETPSAAEKGGLEHE